MHNLPTGVGCLYIDLDLCIYKLYIYRERERDRDIHTIYVSKKKWR